MLQPAQHGHGLYRDAAVPSLIKNKKCGMLPHPTLRLSENPLPEETEPGSNLVASQSFPAHRRENKVTIFKIPGHAPGISTYDRASVRLWRARSPMQVLIVSSLLETKAYRKDFFDTLKGRHFRACPCLLSQSPKLMPRSLASLTMEASGSTIFSLPATSSRGTLTISRLR